MKAMPKPAVPAAGIGWTMNRLWMLVAVCFALIGFAESASTQANQAAGRRRSGRRAWSPRRKAKSRCCRAGKVHVIIGAGGNITVHSGDDGVLMVDTGLAAMTPKVLAALKTISNRPLRYR